MPTAIITGVTGQDGSYLAEQLLARDYRVVGSVRSLEKTISNIPYEFLNRVELVEWSLLDQNQMIETLKKYNPDELYNFAAYSSGAAMYENPVEIGEVNGLAVARILEAIRLVNGNIKFCQASSSELFGDVKESPQSEFTSFSPRTPYGVAKLYADWMIKSYRNKYGLFACSAVLFNHESPRRALGFVTRKITHEAVKIKLGLANELRLGNLNARRDWGFSGDYVRGMWLMLQQRSAEDYVLSTGITHSVRDLCQVAFEYLDLDYRKYVFEDATFFRPDELIQLVGDSEKAKKQLEWENEVSFIELIKMMVDSDLKLLSK